MKPANDDPARDSFYRALGKRLKAARRRAGLSQEKAARTIGMSRTSMTNIECGRQPLQVHVLVHLATVLGEPVSDLLPERDALPIDPDLESKLQSLDPESREWAIRVLSQSTRTPEASDAG